MTEALEGAISAIVNVLSGVSGLRDVPVNPPESIGADTFAVVYPMSGTINIGPIGSRKALHVIAVDVLTTRTDLARDIQKLKPYIDTVADALISEVSDGGTLFTNTINTFGSLSYSWIQNADYGGVPVVGYHFLMNDVKILVNL